MTICSKSAFVLGRGAAALIFSRKIPRVLNLFIFDDKREQENLLSYFNYSPNKIRSGRRHTDCVRTQMVGRL